MRIFPPSAISPPPALPPSPLSKEVPESRGISTFVLFDTDVVRLVDEFWRKDLFREELVADEDLLREGLPVDVCEGLFGDVDKLPGSWVDGFLRYDLLVCGGD